MGSSDVLLGELAARWHKIDWFIVPYDQNV